MFVQVMQGRTSDPAAMRAHMERWVAELAPDAEGWLGSTAGVTADGRAIALARFESVDAARTNSDRPEQSAWWDGMAALYDDEPTFHNSEDVVVDTQGDPGRAGFVQVMQGRVSDMARARELMAADPVDWASFRPDILGSLWLAHEDDGWTMALYFTSEAEARVGERQEPPPELQQMMEELGSLSIGDTTYFDLQDPWLHAPA
jgi:hypothetical protein